jgi:hypothetical protein
MSSMRETDNRPYPIPEDMRFQEGSWRAERVGWLILGLIMAAGLAGLFSRGPLSEASAQGNGFTVDYEWLQRVTRTTRFTLRTTGRLRLGRAFAETYDLETIRPQARQETSVDGALELNFDGGAVVDISARPRRWGLVRLQVAAGSAPPVSFSVFIYP